MFVLGNSILTKRRKQLPTLDRSFPSRSFGWLIRIIWVACQIVLIAWGTLAIYYSNLPRAELRSLLAAAFAVFAVWACWVSRRRGMSVVFLALFVGVVVWWIAIPPSDKSSVATGSRSHAAGNHRW